MKKHYIKFEEGNQESLDRAVKKAEEMGYEKVWINRVLKLQWHWVLQLSDCWSFATSVVSIEDLKSCWYTEIKLEDESQDEYKEWEKVLVRDYEDAEWSESIYLCTVPWKAERPYICVDYVYEEEYQQWSNFYTMEWRKIKKLKEKQETMEINWKTYNKKEVEERLSELKEIK